MHTFPPWRMTLFFFVVSGLWVFFHTPSIPYFLCDSDGGFFITGAYQLRMSGEHPGVHFLTNHGPLMYYLRAISQWAFGDLILAEVALVVLSYAVSYALLFSLMYFVSGSTLISGLLLSIALIGLPRYYKFFVVLVPTIILVAGAVHICQSSRKTSFWLGACVAVSALFRHDYGIYALTVGSIAMIETLWSSQKRTQYVLFAAAGFGVVFAPWLIFASSKIGLETYLFNLFSINAPLSLPHPLFHWANPEILCAFWCVYSVPILLLLLLFRGWRELPNKDRSIGLLLLAASVIFMIQSAHRADFNHLLQSLPPVLVAMSFITKHTMFGFLEPAKNKPHKTSNLIAGCVLAIIAVVITWAATRVAHSGDIGDLVSLIKTVKSDREQVVEYTKTMEPNHPLVLAVEAIRRYCSDSERVAIYPFSPQVAYFSNRLFGSSLLALVPGRFDTNSHQHQTIASLKRHKTKAVLWDEQFVFDGRSDRAPVQRFSLLHDYVRANYHDAGKVGPYTVFVRSKN